MPRRIEYEDSYILKSAIAKADDQEVKDTLECIGNHKEIDTQGLANTLIFLRNTPEFMDFYHELYILAKGSDNVQHCNAA